jgi:hypothetical protein
MPTIYKNVQIVIEENKKILVVFDALDCNSIHRAPENFIKACTDLSLHHEDLKVVSYGGYFNAVQL